MITLPLRSFEVLYTIIALHYASRHSQPLVVEGVATSLLEGLISEHYYEYGFLLGACQHMSYSQYFPYN